MTLCFATNNANKLAEIQALLGDDFQLKTLADIGCHEEIPEEQPTIAGNSRQKAEFVWEKFGVNTFADDTGLEIAALNGEPGVHSAHYAGPQRDADDNTRRVWDRLAERKVPLPADARFLTVITLVLNGEYHQFEGIVQGTIIGEKRGTHGFGYDPVFVPENQSRTFAEMTMAEKSRQSHRARAFAKLVAFLKKD
ncbi:RdgB/HAM1 family non-canonical purine NTP pyrophosphatase [Persicitalea jodogahamensis]|uniref:dITP/XTP pyrophosphatase n=1 Tax=Persicitalea jodogahamensis TaxID=402147 RepID=A0A8J3D7F9_9BACT|nr:RdgB/HAM1 family non-canonical purine NTP pyrophosphatase [Persicitalea jodogahamensis]GHB71959.1 non-canonical purine NTP pyrophosphatase [Persicitalea jodogahamensis]